MLSHLDGLEVSRSNQLVVHRYDADDEGPNIFAMGDCAYLVPKGDTLPIPPRAQAAHQEASHLFVEIQRKLEGEPLRPVPLSRLRARSCRSDTIRRSAALWASSSAAASSSKVCFARLMYRSPSTRCTRWRCTARGSVPRFPVALADAAHGACRQAALEGSRQRAMGSRQPVRLHFCHPGACPRVPSFRDLRARRALDPGNKCGDDGWWVTAAARSQPPLRRGVEQFGRGVGISREPELDLHVP